MALRNVTERAAITENSISLSTATLHARAVAVTSRSRGISVRDQRRWRLFDERGVSFTRALCSSVYVSSSFLFARPRPARFDISSSASATGAADSRRGIHHAEHFAGSDDRLALQTAADEPLT